MKIEKKYSNKNQPEDILPQRNDLTNIKILLKNENMIEIKRLIKSENSNLGPVLRMINLKGHIEKDFLERREKNKFFIFYGVWVCVGSSLSRDNLEHTQLNQPLRCFPFYNLAYVLKP